MTGQASSGVKLTANLVPIHVEKQGKDLGNSRWESDWNVDKSNLAMGINLKDEIVIVYAPVIAPINKFEELTANFFISNPEEDIISARLKFESIDGRPKIIPVIWTKNKLGVLTFEIPLEEVNFNVPFCCALRIKSKEQVYLKCGWLEVTADGY